VWPKFLSLTLHIIVILNVLSWKKWICGRKRGFNGIYEHVEKTSSQPGVKIYVDAPIESLNTEKLNFSKVEVLSLKS
jgi:hypothetical protein